VRCERPLAHINRGANGRRGEKVHVAHRPIGVRRPRSQAKGEPWWEGSVVGWLLPGDYRRRVGRERHVIAIATDVAETKRHSIQGGDSPFGSERCICNRTRRCLLDNGENLTGLRMKASRWKKAAVVQPHLARCNESAVFADIGPIETNHQDTPTRLRGSGTEEVFDRKR